MKTWSVHQKIDSLNKQPFPVSSQSTKITNVHPILVNRRPPHPAQLHIVASKTSSVCNGLLCDSITPYFSLKNSLNRPIYVHRTPMGLRKGEEDDPLNGAPVQSSEQISQV